MQWFGVTYTRRFNNRHSRSGHLFQGRFKSMLIENDAYVVELSCYIHRNPLRAGMVERLIDYKWSSYPVYAYGRKGPGWLKTDLILGYFSGEDPRKAYREKVQAYAGEEKRLWEDFRHGVILGTSQFVDVIKTRYAGGRPHPEDFIAEHENGRTIGRIYRHHSGGWAVRISSTQPGYHWPTTYPASGVEEGKQAAADAVRAMFERCRRPSEAG